METEECEVVRCVCEVDEENDFMIQVTNTHTRVLFYIQPIEIQRDIFRAAAFPFTFLLFVIGL